MGLFRDNDTNTLKWEVTRLRIPAGRRRTSWLSSSLAQDLNSGLLKGLHSDYREQIQLAVRAGLELGASELQVQCSNRSSTLPPAPTN